MLSTDLSDTNPDKSCLQGMQNFFSYYQTPNRRSANVTLTAGAAFVVFGSVTITSLDRAVEYSHGYMDYVPKFLPENTVILDGTNFFVGVGPVTADDLPVVTPNTYTIKLTPNKPKASY